MPSRIRVVLTHSTGNTYWGKRGVFMLFNLLPPSQREKFRRLKVSKVEKMQAASKFLPPDWVLTLIRETRGWRRNRSLYWQTKTAGRTLFKQEVAAAIGVVPQPPQPPRNYFVDEQDVFVVPAEARW